MEQVSGKSDHLKDGDKSLTRTEVQIRPYPEPETLQQYDNVQKGFADRLIKMAEIEQFERHQLSKKQENTTRWGMIFALIAVMPIYGISAYAFYLGHAVEGAGVIIGTTIASLASVFVVRKNLFQSKQEANTEK